MATGPYERVIIVGGSAEGGGDPVEVTVINDQPVNVEVTDPGINTFALTPVGRQTLTVDTQVRQLTVPASAHKALITVTGANATPPEAMRFTADGTNPTSTTGARIVVGDYIDTTDPLMDARNFLVGLKFIRDTINAADCILEIEYFA